MSKLKIVVGSTRPTRAADKVLPWVVDRARANGTFDTEVLDLRDWPLPLFTEHMGSIGDMSDPSYSEPVVKRWNATIKDGDAFALITPEYNHSVPGVLKNAIDNVFISRAFRNKPVLSIGYSGGIGGGIRAIEHLAQIAVEAEMVPLRTSVVIPFVGQAFDDSGQPVNPTTDATLQVALEDLAWWSEILAKARADGQLAPAPSRIQAAVALAAKARDAS